MQIDTVLTLSEKEKRALRIIVELGMRSMEELYAEHKVIPSPHAMQFCGNEAEESNDAYVLATELWQTL